MPTSCRKSFHFSVHHGEDSDKSFSIPRIVSIVPSFSTPSGTVKPAQLYLDFVPIEPADFTLDENDLFLTWKTHFGGARFRLNKSTGGGEGVIGSAFDNVHVYTTVKTSFVLDVAPEVGATRLTDGGKVIGFSWDPDATKFTNAEWQTERVEMSYEQQDRENMYPEEIKYTFYDFYYGFQDVVVKPDLTSVLKFGDRDGSRVWEQAYKRNAPFSENGTFPTICFPYDMNAVQDYFAFKIDGAYTVELEENAPIVGLKGAASFNSVLGYYTADGSTCPFGIFGNKIVIDGELPKGLISYFVNNNLKWKNLPRKFQEKLGLPQEGVIVFSEDGEEGLLTEKTRVSRLSSFEAIQSISSNVQTHRNLARKLRPGSVGPNRFASDESTDSLSIVDLLIQTTFALKSDGWTNEVQNLVVKDMNTIINSYVDADLWKKLFGGSERPVLSGFLAEVAATPVFDEDGNEVDREKFYKSLSTTQLVMALRNSSSEYARLLNTPRASTWSQETLSASEVYKQHSQILYQKKALDYNPKIREFTDDQENNASSYQKEIEDNRDYVLGLVDESVEDKGSGNKEAIREKIRERATKAIENNLYWAYHYFTYCTDYIILGKINQEMNGMIGSDDTTVISRMIQDGVSVLTSLDPSGYFADEYMSAVNTYLFTDVMMPLIDMQNMDVPAEFLSEAVADFIVRGKANDDTDIREAAVEAEEFFSAQSEDIYIDLLMMLRDSSSSSPVPLNPELVVGNFSNRFNEKYPNYQKYSNTVSVMVGGLVTGWGMFAVINDFLNWETASPTGKANMIMNSVNYVLQGVNVMYKQRLKAKEVFRQGRLREPVRMASVSQLAAEGLETSLNVLGDGLKNTGNKMAKWLGKRQTGLGGRKGMLKKIKDSLMSAMTKVLGKNFDVFVASRLGPIFTILGLAFTIVSFQSSKGLARVMDIIGIVEGALGVFAIAGQAFISLGFASATGTFATVLSFAGPLGAVLAIAGFILLLVSLFQKPPDPVKEFLEDYARPQGYGLENPRNSIDYVISRESEKYGSSVVGCALSTTSKSQVLHATLSGTSFDANSYVSTCVLGIVTDGAGRSQITSYVDDDESGKVLNLCETKSGEAKFMELTNDDGDFVDEVKEYVWKTNAIKDKSILDGDELEEMQMTLETVSGGKFVTANSNGALSLEGSAQTWTLQMSPTKPEGMGIDDMLFLAGTTSASLTFLASFTMEVSTPARFAIDPSLPSFLSLDSESGFITTGKEVIPGDASETTYTFTADNDQGGDRTTFKISIVPF